MANDWIIDVLADLRQYALRHDYLALAEQLDDAIVVAAGELIVEADRDGEVAHDDPLKPSSFAPAGHALRAGGGRPLVPAS